MTHVDVISATTQIQPESAQTQPLRSPAVIPAPGRVAERPGQFALPRRLTVARDPQAAFEAGHLASRLSTGYGADVAVRVDSSDSAADIALVIDDCCKALGPEGYQLTVDTATITLRGAAPAGLFYGVQTLLQLIRRQPGGDAAIDCVSVEDAPRFCWRGAMLDVSRHFLPFDFLLKFVDLLAIHKLNVLHLHLVDDQGWRIEIKKYPRLAEVGGYREKTLVGRAKANPGQPAYDPAQETFDDIPHAGFYTQQQARELVAYAAQRHVEIVPEIEMPGHAQAAVAAYPELGCVDEPVPVSPRWGIHSCLFNPSERTLGFLQDVLSEIVEIFPSRYIHIGGDEAVKTQWKQSPAVQQRMRELGLADEHALQSYFIRRMDAFLTSKGRCLIGWDEILEGGLAPNAAVMSWRGEAGGIDAASKGHDVVMAPHAHTYLDYYQSEDRDHEPLAFPKVVTLETVYDYDVIPAELAEERAGHILGAQCQLWSEYMPDEKQVEYMAFPRLCALAERTWSPQSRKDYPSFLNRLERHLPRLDALDVNYRRL